MIMNQNDKMLLFKTVCFYELLLLLLLLFAEMELEACFFHSTLST